MRLSGTDRLKSFRGIESDWPILYKYVFSWCKSMPSQRLAQKQREYNDILRSVSQTNLVLPLEKKTHLKKIFPTRKNLLKKLEGNLLCEGEQKDVEYSLFNFYGRGQLTLGI